MRRTIHDHKARALDRTVSPSHDHQPAAPALVTTGTAAEILASVGDDPARAQEAHDAESASSKPRTTLLASLERIIDRSPA